MVTRLEKQDDLLRNEFLIRIQAKEAAEKEALKEKVRGEVSSLLAKVVNPILGAAFDFYRNIDKAKGNLGESNVGVKLRLGLSNKWILMNDVIVEPEPESFAQIDHVLIDPPGLYIIVPIFDGAFKY